MGRDINTVESEIGEVETKVSALQVELGDLKVKLDRLGAIDDTGELTVDQVAELAAENRREAQGIESEMDAIEASITALQQRRQRLEAELHELQGVKVVKDYKRRLRELYQLCRENNQAIESIIEIRSKIGEMERTIRVSSDYHQTKAYIEAQEQGWLIPTLQNQIGQVEGELRLTSRLGIGLPPKANEVNE